MSTHNIPFLYEKISQICSYGIFFQVTQERVRNSRGKQAISARATEVLLQFERMDISVLAALTAAFRETAPSDIR